MMGPRNTSQGLGNTLYALALTGLFGAFMLGVAAMHAPMVDFDAPHVCLVGQGFYFYGEGLPALIADHHTPFHALHQWFAGFIVDPARAPFVPPLFYTVAGGLMIAGIVARVASRATALLAATLFILTPIVLGSATQVAHEQAGVFWLLASFWLFERATRQPTRSIIAMLLVASIAAVMADHGSLFGISLLVLMATWRAPRGDTLPAVTGWWPTAVLSAALLLGVVAAWHDGPDPQLSVLDARFYLGYDHLAIVGREVSRELALVPVILTTLLLFSAGWRRLRGQRGHSIDALVFMLFCVQAFETIIIREPSSIASLYYLATGVALGSATLLQRLYDALSHRLATETTTPSRIGRPFRLALIMLFGISLVGVCLPGAASVLQRSHAHTYAHWQGYHTASIERNARIVFAYAEGVRTSQDDTIWFTAPLICSLGCMQTGSTKRFLHLDPQKEMSQIEGVLLANALAFERMPDSFGGTLLTHLEALRVVRLEQDAGLESTARQPPLRFRKIPTTLSLNAWQIIAASPGVGLTVPIKRNK